MFNIVGNSYEKYGKLTDLSLDLFPSQGNSYISNDFQIICDKIRIIKNVGILYYLDNTLVKIIEAKNILVYCECDSYIKLLYNNHENFDKNYSTTYVRYSNMNSGKTRKKKSLRKGTLVVPNNVCLPISSSSPKPILSALHSVIVSSSLKKMSTRKTKNLVTQLFNFYCYEVDGVEFIGDTKLYLLKVSKSTLDNIKDKVNAIDIVHTTYCLEKDLSTLDNLYQKINNNHSLE